MATFDDFLEALKTEIIKFAESSWDTYKNAVISDGNAFVEKTKADLERWTKMVANGDLTLVDPHKSKLNYKILLHSIVSLLTRQKTRLNKPSVAVSNTANQS